MFKNYILISKTAIFSSNWPIRFSSRWTNLNFKNVDTIGLPFPDIMRDVNYTDDIPNVILEVQNIS